MVDESKEETRIPRKGVRGHGDLHRERRSEDVESAYPPPNPLILDFFSCKLIAKKTKTKMNQAIRNPLVHVRIFRGISEYDLSRFATTSRTARKAVNFFRHTRPNPLESRVATKHILRYMHNLNRSALAQTNHAQSVAVNEFRCDDAAMTAQNMMFYFDEMVDLGIIAVGTADQGHTFRNVFVNGQPFSYFRAVYDTATPETRRP